jgi:SAM-dependent methyltransferase
MAVFSAYRTGCRADGIDINPYMINIGRHCAEFLQVGDRVRLEAARFEDFKPANKYTAIFSFAVHWTDDEQHRPDFDQYLQRLHSLLADNGLLVFESHTLDVGKKEFYEKMERQRKFYSWDGSKLLDGNKRELFIMRKRATT